MSPAVFVNCSNHPSNKWSPAQMTAALVLGPDGVLDVGFPSVPTDWNGLDEPAWLRATISAILARCPDPYGLVVMVQGEAVASYAIVQMLHARGVQACVAAITERKAVEAVGPDGKVTKTSVFEFAGFRRYPS